MSFFVFFLFLFGGAVASLSGFFGTQDGVACTVACTPYGFTSVMLTSPCSPFAAVQCLQKLAPGDLDRLATKFEGQVAPALGSPFSLSPGFHGGRTGGGGGGGGPDTPSVFGPWACRCCALQAVVVTAKCNSHTVARLWNAPPLPPSPRSKRLGQLVTVQLLVACHSL